MFVPYKNNFKNVLLKTLSLRVKFFKISVIYRIASYVI